jgi:3-hydroxyisobutyrate dehydrogenase/2-hydroxy-3-oxopropionate reductase
VKVGFIGLGNIGNACSAHFAESDFDFYIHDINKSAAENLIALGAHWLDSCKAVAETCDVVFTSLPGPEQVETVITGRNGIIEGAHDGLVVVDLSTISLTVAKEMYATCKATGFSYLDCPVSGGIWAIKAKNLTLMPSGDIDAFEKAKPAMIVFGNKDVEFLGESGTGTLLKLINNQIFLVGGQVFQEGYIVAAKAGLDIKQFVKILRKSSGGMYAPLASMVTKRQWEDSSYDLALAEKDIRLTLETANDMGIDLPMTSGAYKNLAQAKAMGLGEKFFLGTMEAIEKNANFIAKAIDVDN